MYITDLTLNITNNCNLQCKYCFEKDKNEKVMSIDVAIDSIKWLLEDHTSGPHKNLSITFFGGEPLLEFNLIQEIMQQSRKLEFRGKNIKFGVTTNGTLFDEEKMRFWKKNNMGILLSCDGDKKTHDKYRKKTDGKGTHKQVEENFKYILSAVENPEIRMTIMPDTAKYLYENVQYFMERKFKVVAAFPVDEANWKDKDIIDLKKNVYLLGNNMLEKIENGVEITVSPLDTLIKEICRSHDNECDCNTNKEDESLCGAGKAYMAIDYNGNLYPCHRFLSDRGFKGQYPIGNIYEGINEVKRIPFLRIKRKYSMGCDIDCGDCECVDLCNRGCMAVNYQVTGQINQRPPNSRKLQIVWTEIARSMADYILKSENKQLREKYISKSDKADCR